MKQKITLKNIYSYLEGNGRRVLEELNMQSQHIKEQIAYRRLICKDDCAVRGKCVYCNCNFKGKTSVEESCNNGERFPNLMNRIDWEKYKDKNGIK